MTIREFYTWAVENDMDDLDIYIRDTENGTFWPAIIEECEPGKIYLKCAHYSIHSLDDYSLNELEVEQRKVEEENEEYQEKEGYINYVVEKEPTTLYTFLFVFAVIVIVIIICILRSTKCKKPVRTYVRITDNNYMSDDNLYRY